MKHQDYYSDFLAERDRCAAMVEDRRHIFQSLHMALGIEGQRLGIQEIVKMVYDLREAAENGKATR